MLRTSTQLWKYILKLKCQMIYFKMFQLASLLKIKKKTTKKQNPQKASILLQCKVPLLNWRLLKKKMCSISVFNSLPDSNMNGKAKLANKCEFTE